MAVTGEHDQIIRYQTVVKLVASLDTSIVLRCTTPAGKCGHSRPKGFKASFATFVSSARGTGVRLHFVSVNKIVGACAALRQYHRAPARPGPPTGAQGPSSMSSSSFATILPRTVLAHSQHVVADLVAAFWTASRGQPCLTPSRDGEPRLPADRLLVKRMVNQTALWYYSLPCDETLLA